MELREIRAAETLLTLSDRPTTYQSSVPIDTVPESPDDDVVFTSVCSQAATRPSRVLVDPHTVTLPLHSTPLEHDLGTREQIPLFTLTMYLQYLACPLILLVTSYRHSLKPLLHSLTLTLHKHKSSIFSHVIITVIIDPNESVYCLVDTLEQLI